MTLMFRVVGFDSVSRIAAFLRDYVPGFADSYVAQSGVQVGVRETRRILGDYVLTGEDILSARKFDDAMARGTYPVDIHNPNGRAPCCGRCLPATRTTCLCAACCHGPSTTS